MMHKTVILKTLTMMN